MDGYHRGTLPELQGCREPPPENAGGLGGELGSVGAASEGKELAVVDDEPSGPQPDLWALPSEELPPGAAVFLDMARDLQAGLGDPASGWIGSADPGGSMDLHDPEEPLDLVPPAPADPPNLRLVDPPDGPGGSGESVGEERPGAPVASREGPDAVLGVGEETAHDDEAGPAQMFLEMVDLADTVRPITEGDAGDEPAIPEWFWPAGEEGIPASEVLLDTIEQAIQHVNESEDIRSEEVRSRLLGLFGDFAVRRPWRDEERPAAQRIQRLPEQPPDSESDAGQSR